jgi:hypothetical protein
MPGSLSFCDLIAESSPPENHSLIYILKKAKYPRSKGREAKPLGINGMYLLWPVISQQGNRLAYVDQYENHNIYLIENFH